MARPLLSEDEIHQTRLTLVGGAMNLYLELGLDGVSLRQLADRVGVSHTLVYRYFKDKDALLAELRTVCLKELQEALRVGDDLEAAPLDRLRLALATLLTFGCDEPAKYRLIFTHEQPHLDAYPGLLAQREAVFATCFGLVQAVVQERGLKVDALLYTHGFWSLVHGMLSLHTAGQLVHGIDLDHMAVPLLESVLQSLLQSPPALPRC